MLHNMYIYSANHQIVTNQIVGVKLENSSDRVFDNMNRNDLVVGTVYICLFLHVFRI